MVRKSAGLLDKNSLITVVSSMNWPLICCRTNYARQNNLFATCFNKGAFGVLPHLVISQISSIGLILWLFHHRQCSTIGGISEIAIFSTGFSPRRKRRWRICPNSNSIQNFLIDALPKFKCNHFLKLFCFAINQPGMVKFMTHHQSHFHWY